jgi:FAD/FMN-containing dehydrogenase
MLTTQTPRFSELQSRIHGQVLIEGDGGYGASKQAFNLLHEQRPAAVVRVANADDVAETIRYAAQRGLRVAPQGTGHNAVPIDGIENALLLRTDALQEVRIDVAARRARVGAGVRWADVADPASEAGLAPLSGSSRTVGVAGYSLGGGMGWLARKHGLQTNALTAVEIVTADGELRRIDHDNETDLFWAIRGGGGNYGVVTALEFELFEAPEVYAGALFFPYERASEVMHTWHELVARGLPDEITTVARVYQFPPIPDLPEFLSGKSFTVVQAAYLGNEADGAELMRPITELGPDMNTFGMVAPAALGHLAMDPEDPVPAETATRLLANSNQNTIDAFLGAAGPGSGSQLVSVELRSMGGALARRAEGAGARATLQGDYVMFAVGAVMDPAARDAVAAQAEGVSRALLPWDAGMAYANFVEQSTDARLFYDEDTYRLLRALRTQWDPSGLFLANHEIKES